MPVTRREQGTSVVDVLQVTSGLLRGAAEVYPVHRFAVSAYKSSVAANQSDVEVFEFRAPSALTLEEVQVYCTAVNATASVDVKEAGTSVLASAAAPSANAVVRPTISDSAIASGAAVTVHATTDASGSITDLHVTLVFRSTHLAS